MGGALGPVVLRPAARRAVRGLDGAKLIVLGQIRPTTWRRCCASTSWARWSQPTAGGHRGAAGRHDVVGLAIVPVPVRVRLASGATVTPRHRRGARRPRHRPARVRAGAPRRRSRGRRGHGGPPRGPAPRASRTRLPRPLPTPGPHGGRRGLPVHGRGRHHRGRAPGRRRPHARRRRRARSLRVAERHERPAPHGRERRRRGPTPVRSRASTSPPSTGPWRGAARYRGGRAPSRRHRPHALHSAARATTP